MLELVSAAFEYGKRAGLHTLNNPAEGVEAATEGERSRFLQADELPRFVAALANAPQPWRDYFEVLLFVGFRRSATAAMRWADVNLQTGTWTVPQAKSKSGDELVLPLTGRALATLKRRHRERGNSQWVFPGGAADGHLGRAKRAWTNLLAAAQIDDLHLHDLRRSLGSWLAMSGRSLPEIGRVLGQQGPPLDRGLRAVADPARCRRGCHRTGGHAGGREEKNGAPWIRNRSRTQAAPCVEVRSSRCRMPRMGAAPASGAGCPGAGRRRRAEGRRHDRHAGPLRGAR